MLLWRGLSLLCTVEGGASAVPKPSCIQFSILKNVCQPQLLSLKIGKKSLKIGKSETLENHFSFSMTFWQKSLFWAIFWIAFQYYVECTSWNFFSCPGQLSLTDILIQSLSRFYFTVLRAKLYFTSSSFGLWDIFGILICIWDRFQLHRFSGLVTSWRHSICQIVKQYFIRWDIFKTELQVWFEECPIVQDCGRPWELSGCPLLLFLISNDIVTETRLALDCDIQPWDNRWIKNGWGNCLKKLSKHYSGGLRWNFDSGPVGGDGCPLHLPPTLPWTKLCTGPKYQKVQRSHHKVPGTGHCTTVTLREGSGYQIG